MRRAIFITAATVLAVFLASIPAQSAEGVACTTFDVGTRSDGYQDTVFHNKDNRLGVSFVGHFIWLQHTDTPDSLNNIISYDLTGYDVATRLTVCTDGITNTETISEGVGSQAQASTSDGRIVIYSTDEPHPVVVGEWIRVENGYLIT